MSNEELENSISSIKAQMEKALNSHEKDLLGDLMTHVVEHTKKEEKDVTDLQTQLNEQAASFESKHPHIASTLREIAEYLSKMGI